VTTTFDRSANNFGLVNSKTVSWVDPLTGAASRIERTVYDNNGRFPMTVTNAANHTTTSTYDVGTGAVTSVTDLNNLKTNFVNDGLGRVTSATRVLENNVTYQFRKQCKRSDGSFDTACPANAAMAVVTENFNGTSRATVPSVSYVDSVGHPILAKTWGFDGKLILAEQTHDDRTRTYSSYQPHFNPATVFLSKTEKRDVLGRVTHVITKDDQGHDVTTQTEYLGFKRDMTNGRGFKRTEYRDALGRLSKVIDAKNGNMLFEYDAFDNLSKTTDPDTNVIVIGYDDMGHRTSMNDPDLGLITYLVDPIGQVRQQQSPEQRKKGVFTTMSYDAIGRMTDRIGSGEDAHWVFDIGTGAKGQLTEAYTLVLGQKDYDRTHTFDGWGRPVTTSTKLFDATYKTTLGYDAWSRLTSITYQHGNDAAKQYDHRYNASGYLAQLEVGGQRLWTVTDQDAALRVRTTSLGNSNTTTSAYNDNTALLTGSEVVNGSNNSLLTLGYQHDVIGNVTQRTQSWNAGSWFTETMTYDELNRIQTSWVSGQPQQVFSYTSTARKALIIAPARTSPVRMRLRASMVCLAPLHTMTTATCCRDVAGL
jgi:YD repeat-containing protein